MARGTSLFRAVRPEGLREPVEVAIRVADTLDSAAAVSSVRQEYEVLRALDDPRIPKVHGFYPGQAALAISWCGGITLADLLGAARSSWIELDTATALDLATEIASALRAAHNVVLHGRPVVHGHLDPTRVRLDEDGEISVVGFGLERTGQWLGCGAPELAVGQPAGPAADQWALGAILVEMLLLRRLYEDLDDPSAAVMEGRAGPWIAAVEAGHPSLGRLLRKMLAPSPEDRLPWDGEIVQALLAESREAGGVSRRRAIVASVMRRRELVASSPEPAPMKQEMLRISVKPARDEDRDAPPVVAIPIHGGDDDPFSDSPTSPDGYTNLADRLFSDHPTEASTTTDSGELRDADPDSQPVRATPHAAPAPAALSGLLPSERAGIALAFVMACVAVAFLISRLM